MTTTISPSILESADRLCTTLERIGDALVRVDAATLLETEEMLGQVVAVLAAGGTVDSVDGKAALQARINRAGAALLRCRRLGASFASVAGPRLRLRAGMDTYGPSGAFAQPPVSGATVRATT